MQTITKFGTINQPNDDLQKLINERFDKIEENIDNLITKKIAENTQIEVKVIKAKIDTAIHQNKSYTATLQTTLEASNLTNIIKETKNKELVHKTQGNKISKSHHIQYQGRNGQSNGSQGT